MSQLEETSMREEVSGAGVEVESSTGECPEEDPGEIFLMVSEVGQIEKRDRDSNHKG
jgi:hypothetical protein